MTSRSELGTGYSTEVRLQLIVGNQVYPLSKIGPTSVVFREAVELPECAAEVVMHVDGRERRWPVYLAYGAVPFEREVGILDRE